MTNHSAEELLRQLQSARARLRVAEADVLAAAERLVEERERATLAMMANAGIAIGKTLVRVYRRPLAGYGAKGEVCDGEYFVIGVRGTTHQSVADILFGRPKKDGSSPLRGVRIPGFARYEIVR